MGLERNARLKAASTKACAWNPYSYDRPDHTAFDTQRSSIRRRRQRAGYVHNQVRHFQGSRKPLQQRGRADRTKELFFQGGGVAPLSLGNFLQEPLYTLAAGR